MKKYSVSVLFLFQVVLAGFLLFLSGCATVMLNRSRDEFYCGKPVEAQTLMETVHVTRGKNRVLLLMERGLIYQANGEYRKSSRDFLEAARHIEELDILSIHRQAGSFLTSDLILPFTGEQFEKVLVHTFPAINFIKLRKWEDALVECKRALKKLSHSELPDSQPFTNYIAGTCYDIMGEYNDARIEYEKVRKARPDIPFLEEDLRRVSGLRETSGRGELICFIQTGKSPVKRSVELFIPPYKRFAVPEYHRKYYICRKVVVSVTPSSQGRHARRKREEVMSCKSYLMTDIESLAKKTLNMRVGKEILRETARIIAKDEVAKEVEERTSTATANIVRIGFMLCEFADIRSWQTLPAKLEVAKLFPKPGSYDVKIQYFDTNDFLIQEVFFGQVKVEQNKKTFLISRSFM